MYTAVYTERQIRGDSVATTGANVRFYCLASIRRPGNSWPNIAFYYLSALRDFDVRVRALTVGVGLLGQGWAPAGGANWSSVQDSFGAPLGELAVNIVCVPPGLMVGKRATRRQWAPPQIADQIKDGEQIVGQRASALCEMWTEGPTNIAITAAEPEPTADELEALQKYDVIGTPADPAGLRALGIEASAVDPSTLVGIVRSLLHGSPERDEA